MSFQSGVIYSVDPKEDILKTPLSFILFLYLFCGPVSDRFGMT